MMRDDERSLLTKDDHRWLTNYGFMVYNTGLITDRLPEIRKGN